MASNSREARRRKILERGSDRLALITGRIQNLPPPPLDEQQDSSQPSDLREEVPPPPLSDQRTATPCGERKASAVTPIAEEKVSHSELPKHDTAADAGESKTNNGMSNVGLKLNECETSNAGTSGETETSLVSPMMQSSFDSASAVGRNVTQQSHQLTIFAPNQIKSAIVASEKTRLLCSATLAVIVVLSYLGFPPLGSYATKSIITFRPLFLVLLTDVTVVFARLISDKKSTCGRGGRVQNRTPSDDDYNWAAHMSKVLEMVFVMRKVLDAVLMDCSVYVLIVICGLALRQYCGY